MFVSVQTQDEVNIVVGKAWGSSASTHDLVGRWVRGMNLSGQSVVGIVTDIRSTEDGVVVDVLAERPVNINPLTFSCSLKVETVEQVCHQCYGSEFATTSSGSFSFYAGDVDDNITEEVVCTLCGEGIEFAKSTWLPEEEELDEIPF